MGSEQSLEFHTLLGFLSDSRSYPCMPFITKIVATLKWLSNSFVIMTSLIWWPWEHDSSLSKLLAATTIFFLLLLQIMFLSRRIMSYVYSENILVRWHTLLDLTLRKIRFAIILSKIFIGFIQEKIFNNLNLWVWKFEWYK